MRLPSFKAEIQMVHNSAGDAIHSQGGRERERERVVVAVPAALNSSDARAC